MPHTLSLNVSTYIHNPCIEQIDDILVNYYLAGAPDRAPGDEEDRARAPDGAHLPGGVPGDGVPGRLRLHLGQADDDGQAPAAPAAAARQPRELVRS